MLYEYCQARNIPYQKCGKLVVATHKDQLATQLPSLQQHAIQNGVNDTRIITPKDVSALEPDVQCVGALWSPSTGVVDSHSFMMSLLADVEEHGGTLATHSNIVIPENDSDEEIVDTESDVEKDGIYLPVNDDTWLRCQTVINSAGLWAHHVARTLHHYNLASSKSWTIPRQYYAKGNYFRLEGCKNPFQHLVYPLPEPGGLGVHATIDWSGQSVKFGPDVEWISADLEYPEEIDMTPNPARANQFYNQVRKYWPNLPDDALVPDYAGIRPKLHHPSVQSNANSNVPFHDFWIATPEEHGVPGLIHLFGMESPGLTASMAIGESIAQQVKSLS